jgi:predicted GH43/DUF377 family glycosyl hydrolase
MELIIVAARAKYIAAIHDTNPDPDMLASRVMSVFKRHTVPSRFSFGATRLGEIMTSLPGKPHEAWGVLNPGGVRSSDGTMHLFPRLIAEGNYSRIGHARVVFTDDKPVGVERLGIALEPHEPYEVNSGGGGVEDARVVYVPLLQRYIMTYTAYVPGRPVIAVAVSHDLETWQRLGPLRYGPLKRGKALKMLGNKDGAFFPQPVHDPNGVLSFAILSRPTAELSFHFGRDELIVPPNNDAHLENIWISYVAVARVMDDIANLTSIGNHERLLEPQQPWEALKLGTGAPPVHTPGGWLLPYHGVSAVDGHPRYSMGIAILDLDRPTHVIDRTATPVLAPETTYERDGLVSNVVFPSATGPRPDGTMDIYYGAGDRVIAAARITLPDELRSKADGRREIVDHRIANGDVSAGPPHVLNARPQ